MIRAVLPHSRAMLPNGREHATAALITASPPPARPPRAPRDIDMYLNVRKTVHRQSVIFANRLIGGLLNRRTETARGLCIGMVESEVI